MHTNTFCFLIFYRFNMKKITLLIFVFESETPFTVSTWFYSFTEFPIITNCNGAYTIMVSFWLRRKFLQWYSIETDCKFRKRVKVSYSTEGRLKLHDTLAASPWGPGLHIPSI